MSSFHPWWDAKNSEIVPVGTVDAVPGSKGIAPGRKNGPFFFVAIRRPRG
jgi:hypothetical protein